MKLMKTAVYMTFLFILMNVFNAIQFVQNSFGQADKQQN